MFLLFIILAWGSLVGHTKGSFSQGLLYMVSLMGFLFLIFQQLLTMFIFSIIYRAGNLSISTEQTGIKYIYYVQYIYIYNIDYQEVKYLIIFSLPICVLLKMFLDSIFIKFSKSRDPFSKLPWSNCISDSEFLRYLVKIIATVQLLYGQKVYIYIYI